MKNINILDKAVKISILFAFLLITQLNSPIYAENTPYSTYLKAAQNYEAKSNIQKANEFYQKANNVNLNQKEAVFGLAKTYGWLNKRQEADKYFLILTNKEPKNITYQEFYAKHLKDSAQYDLAIEKFLLLNKRGKFDESIAECYYYKGDYKNAATAYEKIIKTHKSNEYIKRYGKSLFFAGDSLNAKTVLEAYLSKNPEDFETQLILSDILLSLNRYEDTVSMLDTIASKHNKRLDYEKYDYALFKIAEKHKNQKDYEKAEKIFNELKNRKYYEVSAQNQLAYIKLEQGKNKDAEEIFDYIVKKYNNNEARLALAQMYYDKEYYLKSIDILKNAEKTDEVNIKLAKNYKKILKASTALSVLEGNNSEEANQLKAQIKENMDFQFQPIYQMGNRSGNVNQYLNSKLYGLEVSKSINPDHQAFVRFGVRQFEAKDKILRTNLKEYAIGAKGKITNKLGYLSEIELDHFSNDGYSVDGAVIFDYTPNDIWKFRTGYISPFIDESLLSATGIKADVGRFRHELAGRIDDNKYIFETAVKLPHSSYAYGAYNIGYKIGNASPANMYQEIMGGVGKVLYSTNENKLLSQVVTGYNIYYTGYQNNRLNYGGVSLASSPIGSDGGDTSNIGGYFSPKGIIVNNLSLKLKGSLKRFNLSYLNEAYFGVQNIKETGSDFVWGDDFGLIWNENGRVGIKLGYLHNFYGVARQQRFYVQLLLKNLLRREKCKESL